MADAEHRGHIARAFESVDRQVPSLTYFGLAFWIAWNTIAFSGSFWLTDGETSFRIEDLVLVHLLSSSVTLIVFALLAKQATRIVAKNWFTFLGAFVAFVGSVLIVITRPAMFPSETLFIIGGCLSGPGTTVLFMRAASLYGAMTPRRSIITLAGCALVASLTYFILSACGNEVASVGFVLMPFCSALLFAIRSKAVGGEGRVLRKQVRLKGRSAVFLVSVLICSAAIEMARSSVILEGPSSSSIEGNLISQVISVALMTLIIVAALLAENRYNYGRSYSLAVLVLALLLFAMASLLSYDVIFCSIAMIIGNFYNLIIWAMLAYIVFQAESGAIRMFALGNAALAVGSLIGGGIMQIGYAYDFFNETNLRIMLVVLGIFVLVDLIFAFSERQIDQLLVPIEPERLEQEKMVREEKKPGQFMLTCESTAKEYGLSERETEVFLLLARGRTAREIAEREVVSVYTIRAHIRSIYAKLDVHSKDEMTHLIEERMDSGL